MTDIKQAQAALDDFPEWVNMEAREYYHNLGSWAYDNEDLINKVFKAYIEREQGCSGKPKWRDIKTLKVEDGDVLVWCYEEENWDTGEQQWIGEPFAAVSSLDDKPYRRGVGHKNGHQARYWMPITPPTPTEQEGV